MIIVFFNEELSLERFSVDLERTQKVMDHHGDRERFGPSLHNTKTATTSSITKGSVNTFETTRKFTNRPRHRPTGKEYLSQYIRPDEETALIVPKDINNELQRKFISCFVISSPKNSPARNAIRLTWGMIMKPIFLMGISDSNTMVNVAKEAQQFNDIIVEDFIESYQNLTIKTGFAMKNFVKHFNNSKFFFKIDDDLFLNPKNLFKLLDGSDVIIGKEVTALKPIRNKNHKWYVPKSLFKEERFPPYVCGGAYVIPGEREELKYNFNKL